MSFPTHTLTGYVIAVVIVMAVIIAVVHWTKPEREKEIAKHCLSFLLGMLAMYIAVHVYGY